MIRPLISVAWSKSCQPHVGYVCGVRSVSYQSKFVVATTESGRNRADLPVWAPICSPADDVLTTAAQALGLSIATSMKPWSKPVPGVPGAFQIMGLLSTSECDAMIATFEHLGFHESPTIEAAQPHCSSASVILPRGADRVLFDRFQSVLPEIGGCQAVGLNEQLRCFRYAQGGHFVPHTDDPMTGAATSVRHDGGGCGGILEDAYGDRLSQLTLLIFLTDSFQGGETVFFPRSGHGNPFPVRTPRGSGLCFLHGLHPESCVHEATPVLSGIKMLVRTQVLYPLDALRSWQLPLQAVKLRVCLQVKSPTLQATGHDHVTKS